MRGMFITLEGIEGAGKSSNLALVHRLLEEAGHPVVLTREPGGTDLGEEVRRLLLAHREQAMGEDTELLLMFAARAEHIRRKIRPALASGEWVLCDRFTDATYAYQGGGRGIPRDRIRVLERWVQGELRPDLTLLLDLPPAMGLTRAGERSAPDRFEREEQAFFERVRARYIEIAQGEPRRVKRVDASRPLPQVQHAIRDLVCRFLREAVL